MVDHGLLDRVEVLSVCDTLYRHHVMTVYLDRQYRARPHRLAIQVDRAGPARAHLTARSRARQLQFLSEQFQQQYVGLHLELNFFSVERESKIPLSSSFMYHLRKRVISSVRLLESPGRDALQKDPRHIFTVLLRAMHVGWGVNLFGRDFACFFKELLVDDLTDEDSL